MAELGREFTAEIALSGSIMASGGRQPGIGVGTWAWGNQLLWGYDPKRDDDALAATFQRCLEQGLRFFDTADSYGTGRLNGRSEALLGRFAMGAPADLRRQLCIATKLAPFPWRLGRQGYRGAFAASQERLQGQMKRVQLHWSTARYAPWQEGPLLDGLADLVRSGAVESEITGNRPTPNGSGSCTGGWPIRGWLCAACRSSSRCWHHNRSRRAAWPRYAVSSRSI